MEVLFSNAQNDLNIDCVLFDLDGTLTSSKARLVDPVINQLFNYIDDVPKDTIEEGIKDLVKVIANKSIIMIPVMLWNISKIVGLSFIQRIKFLIHAKMEFEKNSANFVLLENAEETLSYALEHYKVGIVTSAKRVDVDKLIEMYPIFKDVKTIITEDDVHKLKPNPECVFAALNQLNAKPERTLMIGDLPSDIKTCKQAKIKSVAFLGEFAKYTFELLTAENPDFIVEDHYDFIELLRTIANPINYVK